MLYLILLYLKKKKDKNERNCKEQKKAKEKKESIYFFRGARAKNFTIKYISLYKINSVYK